MAKKGMKRPQRTHTKERNVVPPVPEIQGAVNSLNEKTIPNISGTQAPSQKIFRSASFKEEKPISKAYPEIDTDLGRDNIENDISAADLQDT